MRSNASHNRPAAEADLASAIRTCQADSEFLARLREIYQQVDSAVARLGLVCLGGGACCKFDLFDHRLYVTTGEMALLALVPPPDPRRAQRRRCPWQVGPGCSAYDRRPLGCRTFSCASPDPGIAQGLHQRAHRRIAALHESYYRPYAYGDLTGLVTLLYTCK